MSARLEDSETAFEPISLGIGWGALSLAFFLSALPMPTLLRWLPWRPSEAWMWPVWIVFGTATVSIGGLLSGGIGWWRSGSRTARWGVILNGVVFGLVLLTILAFYWIRFRR